MIKWDLFQGCKDGPMSPNKSTMIHHIKKMKGKNHMIISIEAKKACDKIQHPFMIKTFNKVGIKGTCLNIIKSISEKHTLLIPYSMVKAESSFSKIESKTGMPTPTTFI